MPLDPFTFLPIVFLVVGVLCVILGVRHLVRDRRRRQSWRPHPGRVVASRLDDGQFQACVRYTLDGREFTFWNRYTSASIIDPVGGEVEVLVNPDDPADAVVEAGLRGGFAFGAALIVFGVLAIAFSRRFG